MNFVFDEQPELDEIIKKQQKQIHYLEKLPIGYAIGYNNEAKQFVPWGTHCQYKIGMLLTTNKVTGIATVLYKGFLLKDPVKISATIKDRYVPTYVNSEFERCKESIHKLMPRVRKLKRIKLQLPTLKLAQIIYEQLDSIINGYSTMFGEEQSVIFKNSIVTTPFYIIDNGQLKLYDISKNEVSNIDAESQGNFLCYFMFQYKK